MAHAHTPQDTGSRRRRQIRDRLGRTWRPGVAVAVMAGALAVVSPFGDPAGAAAGTVTGTVFRDFNSDGFMNTTSSAALPAVDVGVAGVTVHAFDGTGGEVATTITAADGTYSLPYVTGDTSTQVRVEFDVPAGYRSGPHGAGSGVRSGTTVQFMADGGQANLGLVRLGDFAQPDPVMVIPVHRGLGGNGSLSSPTLGALYATAYSNSGMPASSTLRVQATAGQIGTVWGIAPYGTAYAFSGATLRRHAPVGPDSTAVDKDIRLGTVYLTAIDTGSPNATPFVQIPNAGTNPRPAGADARTVAFDWFHDAGTFAAVGKVGLGDIDISPDRSTLYVVNLNDRNLYAVPVSSTGGAPVAGTPVAIPMPLSLPGGTACPGTVRPWALEVNADGVWAGLTCTGTTQADLRMYVYRFDPAAGSWDGAPAYQAALSGYPRGVSYANTGISAEWRAWTDTFTPTGDKLGWAQPVLSDIEFDSNGDLTLAILDRDGPQSGLNTGDLTPGSTGIYQGMAAGDILRACRSGSTWVEESFGSCGGRTGYSTNNNQGPGSATAGGEFYADDYVSLHQQIGSGATEQVPGFPDIVAVLYDPSTTNVSSAQTFAQGGWRKLRNSNGGVASDLRVYGYRDGCANATADLCEGTFAKSGGIGDVEALLADPPLEIGNRVWLDADGDGVQDPGTLEKPIAGVTVRLFDASGGLVASTVTAADGTC